MDNKMKPPLLVLGLDGMSWHAIKQMPERVVPYLRTVATNMFGWKMGILHCDGIPHSAPSWTTIFTGLLPQQHGVVNWRKPVANGAWGDWYTQHDISTAFVWEILQNNGIASIAFDIFATLPPISFNAPYEKVIEYAFPETIAEFATVCDFQYQQIMDAVVDGYELITAVNIVPDKAHHLSNLLTGDNLKGAVEAYRIVDNFVGEVVRHMPGEKILLSDHGLPGPAYTYQKHWQIFAHETDGMIATTLIDKPIPTSTLGITPFILDYFEVSQSLIGTTQLHYEPPQLTVEQGQILEKRLKDLGYFE